MPLIFYKKSSSIYHLYNDSRITFFKAQINNKGVYIVNANSKVPLQDVFNAMY